MKILHLNDQQLRALESPRRAAVLDVIRRLGVSSIPELARELECSPKGLYHHVNLLLEVGLIRSSGTRPSTRREEVVYEPVAENFRSRFPNDPEARRSHNRVATQILKNAGKAYVKVEELLGDEDPLRLVNVVAQTLTRLSAANAEALANELREMLKRVKASEEPGQTRYMVTLAMSPIPPKS